MHKIESRFINENLKKGWTIEDFAEKLEMSSEEFTEALHDTFNSRACRAMIASLKTNEKRKAKRSKKSSDTELNDGAILVLDSESEFTTDSPLETNPSLELQKLEEEKSSLEENIASLENEREELYRKRKSVYSSLNEEKEALLEMLKQIESHEKVITNLSNELDDISKQAEKFNEEIALKNSELLSVMNRIQELSKISIFVYQNGSFELDNTELTVEVSEEDEKALFEAFTKSDAFEELTLKQIKAIAKLKIITEKISSNFDITFESEEMEKAFISTT
ncbi:MAG: hypothetical protein IJ809_01005 [Clostridia bacterium]|nr:hypothetical protein [Clostridia bacterium]